MKLKKSLNMALAMVVSGSMAVGAVPTALAADTGKAKGYEERLTPIMGWSSWNEFAAKITEQDFIENMDLMKEYGLVDLGYEYFNTDDGYQGGRDEDGYVTYNEEKFPHGMKYIADYAHSLGMKAGIYTDLGIHTCASVSDGEGDKEFLGQPGTGYGLTVGLYENEEKDLRHYFGDWGFDFIKVDYCGARDMGWALSGKGTEQYNKVGDIIEELRNEYGRDIIYNVCAWQFPGEAVVNGEADSWRTGGDLSANFDSIVGQLDRIVSLAKYSKPGKSNDLDMLQIGRNNLTHEENKTHFTMWCMAASPLMIGADLRKISPQALEVLKNKELIDIDQDPANICASVVKTISNFDDGDSKPVEIWRKDLGEQNSSTKAIAILNRANTPREVKISWNELGFCGDVTVRDLWKHQYVNVEDGAVVTVPAHGTLAWKVEGILAPEVEEENLGDAAEATVEMTVSDKPETMNLTELGTADWFYYKKNSSTNVTFRRKAGVESQLSVSAGVLSDITQNDYYPDSATKYSWTDGVPEATGTNERGGHTISNQMGHWVQVDAQSDSREHTLYVPVTGWYSDVQIDVLVNGEIVDTQTVNGATWTDNQIRVNKLATVKFSSDIPATVSVRWTIVGQHRSNGNIALESAALAIDSSEKAPAALYGSATEVLKDEVNLEEEGTLDYIQFGGENGTVSAEKSGADLLSTYAAGENGAVVSADSDVIYRAGDVSGDKGAAQSALNSKFIITLPAVETMTKAKIYLGVEEAAVALRAANGNLIFSDDVVETGKSNRVMTLYYKSPKPIRAALKMAGSLGDKAKVRLDAITLAEAGDVLTFDPKVSQKDDILSVSAEVIDKGDSISAKTMEVKLYNGDGVLTDTLDKSMEQTWNTTASTDIELPVGFVGKAEVRILDADGQALSDTYEYVLPMATRKNSAFLGRYTAQKMVRDGAILVDVRKPEEFARNRIDGAINIPQNDLIEKADEILSAAGATKDTKIIVYCTTGKRSGQSREILMDMGYKNVYDFGGYEKWYVDPTVLFSDYTGMITGDTPITIGIDGVEHEVVQVKYSVGADSTVEDAKDYEGAFTLADCENIDEVVKAYLLFEGEVVYETSYNYQVFVDKLPDLTGFEGVYCSDLPLKDYMVGWSTVKNDKTADNNSMKIAGRAFPKGVSGHAPSYMVYDIPEGMNRFVAVAGCDDEIGNHTPLIYYSVYIDGVQVDRTAVMTSGRYYVFDIAIPEGAKEIKLEAKNAGGRSNSYMHSEWGIAEFVYDKSLEESAGKIILDVTPADAEVTVTKKGETEAIAPAEDGSYVLMPGKYTYTVNKEGYTERTGDFTVASGEEKTISVQLRLASEGLEQRILEIVYNTYAELDTSAYTQESGAALRAALADAQIVLNGGTVEGKRDQDVLQALLKAAAGLKTDTTGLEKDVDAAQAAAQTAQVAADIAQETAVQAKADAEAAASAAAEAQKKAEAAEAAAEAAETAASQSGADKEAVEKAKAEAQTAQAAAETAEKNAADAAAKAQAAAEAAEEAQSKAEAAKTAAETAQTAAENAKNDAEGAKAQAEAARIAAETARDEAQSARDAASAAQMAAESAKESAVSQADLAEAAKSAAEAAQAAAEAAKAAAEAARDEAAETLRKAQEEAAAKLAEAEESRKKVQAEADDKLAKAEALLKEAKELQEQTKEYMQKEAFKAQKVTITAAKSKKKKTAKITWKKVDGAEGYVIEYARKANFKGAKTVTVKKGTAVSRTLKKLNSKKTYYVRVKAYKTVNGEKIYTGTGAKKKVRIE